ncbi:helix-turn-helix transcriptional regulator [Actinoalloteichus hymeniacidonis]|uniref:Transcriptional regulator n=1 Tax=Actinoalloteichus hymeniacidonis TaxID=340345 RepID=A0AAC9HQ13_9PSEU|nr:WYL domain-containing protein [Actinoalloteichus hymeniacidonis]AOS63233.1 putative transcriptional regulator [Actinoalloteichus hymeniacidonis]MBB5908728.1 proteasome accessory factor C [Actinoalloteichus hymeniacidonis]
MSASSERLSRLLSLVPYLLARPGIPIAEAAADFDVTPRQLRKDLELLWMCGLPGYGPGDLIDLSFDDESVMVSYDAGMSRPLRLTTTEATSLLVALRALTDDPGVTDVDAVARAVAKIEAAVGRAQPSGVVVGLGRHGAVREGVRDSVQQALERRRALRLRYYTASRDEISERTIDPTRLVLLDGRDYLEGWCRSAEGMRLFRMDRIDQADVTDEPAAPPKHAEPVDLTTGAFRPAADQHAAVLVLDRDVRWVAEYHPVEDPIEVEGGRLRVTMRYSDSSWMLRLVLGLGGRVQILEPASLAEAVRSRAGAALSLADKLAEDLAADGIR